MQCLKPNKGHYDSTGKHIFGPSRNGHEHEHDLPCGYCESCRTNKAKLRGFKHFSTSLYVENSCFLTLTYKLAPITPNGLLTLDKSVVPLFIKRLRKYIFEKKLSALGNGKLGTGRKIFKSWSEEQKKHFIEKQKIGVLYCGEYGEDLRPHYHVIIYNYDFSDKKFWRTSKSGYPCYRSLELEKLWPCGHSETGSVTPASATYVASYIYKKQYGSNASKYGDKIPEYVVTPKKNFVSGRNYIRKNIDSIAQHGCFVALDGQKIGIDTHTLNWIKNEYPEHWLKIKLAKESYEMEKLTKTQIENWKIIQASKQQQKTKRR